MHVKDVDTYKDVGGAIRVITGDLDPLISRVVVVMDLTGDTPKLLSVDVMVDTALVSLARLPLSKHLERLKLTEDYNGKIVTWKSLVLPPDNSFDSRPIVMEAPMANVDISLLSAIEAHDPLGDGDPVVFDKSAIAKCYKSADDKYRCLHARYYLTKKAPILLYAGTNPGNYSIGALAGMVTDFTNHATRTADAHMLTIDAEDGLYNAERLSVRVSYTHGCDQLVCRHVDAKTDSTRHYWTV